MSDPLVSDRIQDQLSAAGFGRLFINNFVPGVPGVAVVVVVVVVIVVVVRVNLVVVDDVRSASQGRRIIVSFEYFFGFEVVSYLSLDVRSHSEHLVEVLEELPARGRG